MKALQRTGEHLKTIHDKGLQSSLVKESRDKTFALEKPLAPGEAVSILLGEFFICILQMSLRAPLNPFLSASQPVLVLSSTRVSLRHACFLCFSGKFIPWQLWLRYLIHLHLFKALAPPLLTGESTLFAGADPRVLHWPSAFSFPFPVTTSEAAT